MADDDTLAKTLAELLSRLGADVAVPLTQAQERLRSMANSGRIDRQGLTALDEEVDKARRLGMRGQQIARLINGIPLLSPERINLAALLEEALDDQAQQLGNAQAIGNRKSLQAIDVIADASLAGSILRAAADWSLAHAQVTPIDWKLELTPWPARARLSCRIVHQPEDLTAETDRTDPPAAAKGAYHLPELDSLDWLALRLAAHLGKVEARREDGPGHSTLWLEFPDVAATALPDDSPLLGTSASGPGTGALPAGAQLLVLANRREVRQLVRDAMQTHDIFIDYVPSVIAAQAYCRDGTPQALIFETAFTGEALSSLCRQLDAVRPRVALLEVLPTGDLVEESKLGGASIVRLGPEALRTGLAAQLAARLSTPG